MERRLAAILAADLVGYSRLMSVDEEGTLARLKQVRSDIVIPVIERHQGRIFKTTGDGFFAIFGSVVGAVRSGLEIQAHIRQQQHDVPDEKRLQWRIGVNVGDVISEEDDVYGDGVNIAARLEEIARPGSLAVSAAAYEQVRNKLDQAFSDRGHQRLKNIGHSVHVYDARMDERESPLASGGLFDFDEDAETSVVRTGSCLCGAIRFEIDKPPISSGFCHCRICQKFTGAPVSVWTAVPVNAVRFTSGAPKLFHSSPIAVRGFCGDCGTSLTYRLIKPEPATHMVIFTAAFDKPEEMTPVVHGGMESRMPWLDINDDLPRSLCEESKVLREAWGAAGLPEPSQWQPIRKKGG